MGNGEPYGDGPHMPCHFKNAQNMGGSEHCQSKRYGHDWNRKIPASKRKLVCAGSLLRVPPLKPEAKPDNKNEFVGKYANQ